MKTKIFFLFSVLLYISAVTAAEVGARLMPAAFQGNVFHIAEGTPAVLNLKAWRADKKMPYRGILTVELPPEIAPPLTVVVGSAVNLPLTTVSETILPVPLTERS